MPFFAGRVAGDTFDGREVGESCTEPSGDRETVSGAPGRIVGRESRKFRREIRNERRVGAESARCEDDALAGVHEKFRTVAAAQSGTNDAALGGRKERFKGGFGQNPYVRSDRLLTQGADVGAPSGKERLDAAWVKRSVNFIIASVENDAALREPANGIGKVFRECRDDFGIRGAAACRKRLFTVKRNRIVDPGGFLCGVSRGGKVTRAPQGVAAQHRKFFREKDMGAQLSRGDGGRQSRAPAARDEDVVLGVPPEGGVVGSGGDSSRKDCGAEKCSAACHK